MRIFHPNSSAVSQIAFDTLSDEGEVLVTFKDGDTTYCYGPWPLRRLKNAVMGNGSVGREIARLRKTVGDACNVYEGDCQAAIDGLGDVTYNMPAPSARLNCGEIAILGF
jgi:hypothetical protein